MNYSIVINATWNDGLRLKTVLPNVVDKFGDTAEEIIVLIDKNNDSGRIGLLHGVEGKASVDLKFLSDRVKYVEIEPGKFKDIESKYTRNKKVRMCSSGTPLIQYLYAIDVAVHNIILRMDCDILFAGNFRAEKLEKYFAFNCFGIAFPNLQGNFQFMQSTRCFFINRDFLENNKLKLRRSWRPRALWSLLRGNGNFVAFEKNFDGIYRLQEAKIGITRTLHIPRRVDCYSVKKLKVAERIDFDERNSPNTIHDFRIEDWSL